MSTRDGVDGVFMYTYLKEYHNRIFPKHEYTKLQQTELSHIKDETLPSLFNNLTAAIVLGGIKMWLSQMNWIYDIM